MMVTVNHEIDFEKAQEIALEYDIIAEPEAVSYTHLDVYKRQGCRRADGTLF